MPAAAKKKAKQNNDHVTGDADVENVKENAAPTLAQRIEALRDEVDAALDQLAEEKHPPSVPGPWMRQNWMGKASGNLFEAYLIGRKEFPYV